MSKFTSPVVVTGDDKMSRVSPDGGAIMLLELLGKAQILRDLPRSLPEPSRGWTSGQMLLTLLPLHGLDHECVSDVDELEENEGLRELVRLHEPGLLGVEEEELAARFRGGRGRVFPSASSPHDWLRRFHDMDADPESADPRPSQALGLIHEARWRLAKFLIRARGLKELTLDMDATIVRSGKREARPTYRAATGAVPGERGYQPLVVYCQELDMALETEFRPGSVPASKRNLELLKKTLAKLPPQITRVNFRSDGAGYQRKLTRFLNDPKSRPKRFRRFGPIPFAISAPRDARSRASVERATDWMPVPGKPGMECAELDFLPEWKWQDRSPLLRYVATRTALEGELGVGHDEIPAGGGRAASRFRVYVTNFPHRNAPREGAGRCVMDAATVVRFAHERCGRGERIHSVLKRDMAGGRMPSGKFAVNAAWWHLAALAANLRSAVRYCALGRNWLRARMKRVRRRCLRLAARIVRHARNVELRFSTKDAEFIKRALLRIHCACPPGDTS